jgi:hypothetical protein
MQNGEMFNQQNPWPVFLLPGHHFEIDSSPGARR